jgi:CHAT domain-containing protein
LRWDDAIALLARARVADPAFFPAQHEYFRLRWGDGRGEFLAVREAYAVPDPRGGTVTECLALATAAFPNSIHGFVPAEAGPLARLESLERRGDPSGCAASYLAQLIPFGNQDAPNPVALSYARRSVALAPEVAESWVWLQILLGRNGQAEDGIARLEDGLRHVPDALGQTTLYLALIAARRAQGDSIGAERVFGALRAAGARDTTPLIRVETGAMPAAEFPRAVSAAGDWAGRLRTYVGRGRDRVDQGNPAGAMPPLDSAVTLADSVGLPWNQLVARLTRGRAESKLGRLAAAERDLRGAITIGAGAPDVYYLAEAWHNLAHVYEGQGRWTEAAAAVDRFVALTQPMRFDDHRVVSLYDAGTIRWEAGWHAAAQADFAAMVRAVDDQRASGYSANDYWAGEYFERSGDFARALAYYQTGDRFNPGDPRTLSGLARAYEALGRDDSAERKATTHDSVLARWTPLERPLLPEFLARHGRSHDGIAVARQWAARQISTGNVQGAALATLQVATLELAAGHPTEALRAAGIADSLAASLHFVDGRVGAGELAGKALVALGRRDAGVRTLQRSAALAAAHPTTTNVFATQLALGDALAAGAHPGDALRAYDRAARIVEIVTARLVEDLDRAGYRERHLDPFDGALAVLLAQPASPARTDALLRWSERRKAAALALATGQPEQGPGWLRSSAELQRALGPRDAVIDYLVLPGHVAAIVLTNRGALVVRLPIEPDSLQALVLRLRHPLLAAHAGRVDLARAPFDLAIAHRLYEQVLQPLEPELAGRDRLAIAPDGPLHLVPFAALVTAAPPAAHAYAAAQYLVDRVQILLLPAVQFLDRPVSDRVGPLHVVAVMGDAPGAGRELALIQAAVGASHVDVIAGADATPRRILTLASRYDVFHFAVHAIADDRDPLASHLRLAPEAQRDGFLNLTDIARVRWHAPLVVLSACETLTGPVYKGEGMMGLARAFLETGVGTVVATEWPVGSTSADLMGEFYRGLTSGSEPAAALRASQLALRRSSATSHPFFWAGFDAISGHGRATP